MGLLDYFGFKGKEKVFETKPNDIEKWLDELAERQNRLSRQQNRYNIAYLSQFYN